MIQASISKREDNWCPGITLQHSYTFISKKARLCYVSKISVTNKCLESPRNLIPNTLAPLSNILSYIFYRKNRKKSLIIIRHVSNTVVGGKQQV